MNPTPIKKIILFIILPILLVAFLPVALAQIALVGPENGAMSNAFNTTFDYYVGIENPVTCTLNIPPQTLPDITVQQGLNAFIVQGIDEGSYDWNIACENTTETQTSETRTLIMDFTAPTLQLTLPGMPAEELTMQLLVTDNASATFSCDLLNNGIPLDTITIQNNQYYEANYALLPNNYELQVACTDEAGNTATETTNYDILATDFLILETNKETYSLGETILLTIDAPPNTSVAVDICPDVQGFVECVSPIILPGFPQTLQLPLNNQSGDYLVEGILNGAQGVLLNNTRYTIENTIGLTLDTNKKPRLNETFLLTADVYGAIGDVTYTWELHNGSTYESTTDKFTILPKTTGEKTDTLTITDAAGNTRTQSITYYIKENLLIDVIVRDEQNNSLAEASVQAENDEVFLTDQNGIAQLRLELGTNKLYAAKQGYESVFTDVFVDENTTQVALSLKKEPGTISVVIDEPANEQQFTTTNTIPVKFTTQGITDGACIYFMALDNESFLEQESSLNISKDGQTGFGLSELDPGRYAFTVECTQGAQMVSTEKQYFNVTVAEVTPPVYTEDPNSERELFENALATIRSLGAKEQTLIEALGLEKTINKARKQAGQLSRDIFDIRYRTDLAEEEQQAEQARLRTQLDTLLETTPISLDLLDQQTLVTYITEEELRALLEKQGETLGLAPEVTNILLEAQQGYTMKTILYRARIKYGDGEQTTIGVVSKTFTYGKEGANRGGSTDKLIEIIPKAVARSAKDLFIITKEAEVLLDDPILQFPAGNSIVYYVKKDISLSGLEDVRTVLVPEITISDNAITGYSVFGAKQLSGLADNLGISFSVLIALLVAAYLSYYFGLIGRVKYLFYQGGPKTKLHYLRVLLNDVHDNLQANNYEKALLLYKEIKLTYDQLEVPAQNELFEEITMVCAELDTSFMKHLVIEMDAALKKDQLQTAIEYYVRIEATYERLPAAEQQQVQNIVSGLGKRLGLEVHA